MGETKTRSLIKGFSWRLIGTLDTIFWSFTFIGNMDQALKIGAFEIFTKTLFYFIHERIWLVIGKRKKLDSRFTSFAKAVSWRIVGTLDTVVISLLVIKISGIDEELKQPAILIASAIGIFEFFTKILLFYVHERVWNRIGFGRRWI